MTSSSPRGRIDFIGVFPPPVTGVANANEATASALVGEGFEVRRHDLSPHSLSRGPAYHLSRLMVACRTVGRLLTRPPPSAAITLDGGLGAAYGVAIVAALRLRKARLAVHHHNFTYIDAPSALVRAFLRAAPSDQLHVFLCAEMEARFRQAYAGVLSAGFRSLVLSNAFMIEPPPAMPRQARAAAGEIVLGLLSNLSKAKGVDLFLDLIERLAGEGRAVRAILAGPIADPTLRERIDACVARGHVEYRGPVYGDAKARFFSDIDIFVFPTKYPNEAQPLVLLEAMANGKPFATIARGCIDCDHAGSESLVAKGEATFLDEASAWLTPLFDQAQRLLQVQRAASARFESLRRSAAQERDGWIAALIPAGASG